ncbi:MAG: 50S ribosomal protein L11 methyltransferase [Pseudomonadales bacterium]|nr:50S ribosomal protein L11 methyltransferase [Pseudomonadales bacterium]
MTPQAMQALVQTNLNRTISNARIEPVALPLCPSVSLYLISEDYPRGKLEHDEMIAILNDPAYWAFCWASGQVLARYIISHPDTFKGRTVLDFGAGSGVVAVAAAKAGAARVIACDIDPLALDACRANAELNKVEIHLLDDIDRLAEPVDMIIAADVLYDRDNISWLDRLPALAPHVIVADSRFKQVELHGYDVIDRVTATTIPDLDEMKEFNHVKIYELKAG